MYILRPGIDRCPCCGSIIPENIKRKNLLVITIMQNNYDARTGTISSEEAIDRNQNLLAELESEKLPQT